MSIKDRVDVTVIDETLSESVPSFSIPLVLGTTGIAEIKDEIIVLESMSDLPGAVDPTTKEYQALQKIFSQSPHADTAYLYSFDRSDYQVGELTTGSGETEIIWRSLNEGSAATNIQVEIDPVNGHDLAVDFYKQLWFESGGTTSYLADSPTNSDFKIQTKQPDYDRVYSVEITTATSQGSVTVSLSDTNGDGDPDKLTLTIDDAGDTTANDIVDAINNHAEASALFSAEAGGDGTGSFSSAVSTVSIPFTVRAIPQTGSGGTVESTAQEVAEEVNNDMYTDAPMVVSVTSDGTDTVSATGPSNLSLVTDSPASVVRGLDSALEKFEEQDMEKPYFLVSTTYGEATEANEVAGDRVELANAVSAKNMIYGTSNYEGESATQAKLLAATMASDRAFVFAHKNKETGREWPEACLIGKWSGHDLTVGQTFAPMWSSLNSLTTSKYTPTEQARLEGEAPLNSAAFTYKPAKDTPVVTGSWSTSGEYLDWRQQKDYIESLVETRVVAELVAQPVVPGDARGLAELQTAVESAFSTLVARGIIGIKQTDGQEVPMFELSFPSLDEWSELSRAERAFIAEAKVSPAWAIEQFDLTVYATLDTSEF